VTAIDGGRVHAIILAGGTGQRFWPISRDLSPKQLLGLFGTESLVAQAIHRVLPLLEGGSADALVVTNELLFDELRNNLTAQADTSLHEVEYLVEPTGRNTAPAVALACAHVRARDPEGIVVVLPSDHVLDDGQVWRDTLACATGLARAGYLATIGIEPTRAETGYGYIRQAEALPAFAVGCASPAVAGAFVEKPDELTAAAYVADGGHLWNAGIFVMRASDYLDELRRTPANAAIADAAEAIAAGLPQEDARERFAALPSVSIDVAVMESAERVAVVPAAMGWSDVGSLLSLETLAVPDAAGNVRTGRGVDVNSSNVVVYSGDRLVATLGVSDLIVVDTTDATLVARKDAVHDIRLVVDALRSQGAPEVTQPRTSLRPWGTWTTLLELPGYKVKEIGVKPGCRASLQRHGRRGETWIVASGRARVTRGDDTLDLGPGESIHLPAGVTHRMGNASTEPLRIIEVQIGDYLGEDDVERLADDWHRESTHRRST
jgi:mannose-1-phosphate guanylyltransferase/mannose-6-phosphate isomerase